MNDMEFLKKEQICKLLQISPRTLSLWMARDGLPMVKIGNVCRYQREAVWNWFMQFQKSRKGE